MGAQIESPPLPSDGMFPCRVITPCEPVPIVDKELLLEMVLGKVAGVSGLKLVRVVKGGLELSCDFDLDGIPMPGEPGKTAVYAFRAYLLVTANEMPVEGDDVKAFVTRQQKRIVFNCLGTVRWDSRYQ